MNELFELVQETEAFGMLSCGGGGLLGGLVNVIGGLFGGGLFGGGRDGGGNSAQPVAPDVTQSQDQKAAAEEERKRRLAASQNSTTATSGLGTTTEAQTTSKTLG